MFLTILLQSFNASPDVDWGREGREEGGEEEGGGREGGGGGDFGLGCFVVGEFFGMSESIVVGRFFGMNDTFGGWVFVLGVGCLC